MTKPTDASYAGIGRDLADTLMRWARDRRTDDQKQVGALQHQLCQMRRAELSEPDDKKSPDEPTPGP
ncbi:MAG: hypothetical protein J2P55_00250 [Rhizobiales bacterium]|nr:hypothetical protein [Hyphomicrobiales bacterium]